jgi:hypothetical protein
MLEAQTKGSPQAADARRAKSLALALFVIAGCLLLTACPPDGGDLVPLARGDGASLATKSFEGDTFVVTREGVTLRARGRWSVADAATSVILEASNANAEPAAVDFGRGELSRDGGAGRMTLRSVTRESGAGGAVVFLQEKKAEVAAGGAATFVLEFKIDSEDGRSGVPRDVTGQTVTLRLPVELKAGRTSATEFVFVFEYAERRPRR